MMTEYNIYNFGWPIPLRQHLPLFYYFNIILLLNRVLPERRTVWRLYPPGPFRPPLYLWFLRQAKNQPIMTSRLSHQQPKPAQQPPSSSGEPKSLLGDVFFTATAISSANRAQRRCPSAPRILHCLWQSRHANAFSEPIETAVMVWLDQSNVLKCHQSMLRLSSQKERERVRNLNGRGLRAGLAMCPQGEWFIAMSQTNCLLNLLLGMEGVV